MGGKSIKYVGIVSKKEKAKLVRWFLLYIVYVYQKSNGPKMEPYGTPQVVSNLSEILLCAAELPGIMFQIQTHNKAAKHR